MAKSRDLARIIVGCKAGEPGSFEQLVDRYAHRCYGYFYRLTGSKELSDDLLGELFVKLVGKIRSFKGGTFEVWLFRTASNVFRDHLRKKQKERKVLETLEKQVEADPIEAKESDVEQIDKLQMQLGRLDAETRELIMLRFYSELSFREMAKLRGESVGTTLSKVHRGLKKLRELMEGRF
jgi:RNA polymerase sigma-70 factor (ECF subfamily)